MGRQQGKRQSMANEVRDEYAASELLTRACATRTCAHCGERDASREGYDRDDDRWYAVCFDCSRRVDDPPIVAQAVVTLKGFVRPSEAVSRIELQRAKNAFRREQAAALGLCPVCLSRPSRDAEVSTCVVCLDIRNRRKAVPR